jgi:hypothetical protein
MNDILYAVERQTRTEPVPGVAQWIPEWYVGLGKWTTDTTQAMAFEQRHDAIRLTDILREKPENDHVKVVVLGGGRERLAQWPLHIREQEQTE